MPGLEKSLCTLILEAVLRDSQEVPNNPDLLEDLVENSCELSFSLLWPRNEQMRKIILYLGHCEEEDWSLIKRIFLNCPNELDLIDDVIIRPVSREIEIWLVPDAKERLMQANNARPSSDYLYLFSTILKMFDGFGFVNKEKQTCLILSLIFKKGSRRLIL